MLEYNYKKIFAEIQLKDVRLFRVNVYFIYEKSILLPTGLDDADHACVPSGPTSSLDPQCALLDVQGG